jgi:RNA recognition motif-containing protein
MRSQNFRGNVFVANLPPEISDEQLAEAFDAFGIVLSATVAHDPETGKRLRYGFVDIATERAAKLAVASMNGAAIDGYNLDVRISERPVAAKKPRAVPPAAPRTAGVPQRSPRRVMPRPGANYDGGDEERPGTFTPRPQPRKQPSFQVERRSLPRRSG